MRTGEPAIEEGRRKREREEARVNVLPEHWREKMQGTLKVAFELDRMFS